MVLLTHFRPDRPLTAAENEAITGLQAMVARIETVKAKHRRRR